MILEKISRIDFYCKIIFKIINFGVTEKPGLGPDVWF